MFKRMMIVGLVALSGALPAAAQASTSVDFATPGAAVYCVSDLWDFNHLACWTPNDGFVVQMKANGRASKHYDSDFRDYHARVNRRLGFGQTWWNSNFECYSRRTGLTCTNRRGHGWWLGRYVGYRIF